jgi:hypothetical protein
MGQTGANWGRGVDSRIPELSAWVSTSRGPNRSPSPMHPMVFNQFYHTHTPAISHIYVHCYPTISHPLTPTVLVIMPPRLNKRQQREQDELLALSKVSDDIKGSNDDYDRELAKDSVKAGFAAVSPESRLSLVSTTSGLDSQLYIPEEEQQEESPDEELPRPTKSRKVCH